ncbi:DUF2513 domain-containing protein [Staphylococcus xylosus]|uniref:DUF2513 domain-containing protein n=1 Tax=Staphylococcus xylosus TaxID=1288 RepID=UPI0015FBDD55|nr:DUF2513 domain-containing protein [Staphylococcus xylosus]
MKLNQDCLRDLMLELEDKLFINTHIYTDEFRTLEIFNKYSDEDVYYSLKQLIKMGLIDGATKNQAATVQPYYIDVYDIEPKGHEFLNNVRDENVWKETKKRISKFASVSIPVLQQVSKAVIQKMAGLS